MRGPQRLPPLIGLPCPAPLVGLQLLNYATPARQLADDELSAPEFDQEYFDRWGEVACGTGQGGAG